MLCSTCSYCIALGKTSKFINTPLKIIDFQTKHVTFFIRLERALNNPPFVSGGASTCIECHQTILDSTWKLLKGKMIAEMDKRPLGDTILEEGLSSWPEAISCWKAACPNQSCRRLLFDRSETIRVIRNCIKELKDTV